MQQGALVTIDAMGTQREIAQQIVDGGGDYCLALKENHPLLHAEVERFFSDPEAEVAETHTTVDGDHGRIEERRHVVCHDVDWLLGSSLRRRATVPAPGHDRHGRGQRSAGRHRQHAAIRSTKATASLEVRRKKAAWSTAYLARVLRGSA